VKVAHVYSACPVQEVSYWRLARAGRTAFSHLRRKNIKAFALTPVPSRGIADDSFQSFLGK
jgi:hypothetical protein